MTTNATQARVRAVVRRLTMAPATAEELVVLAILRPGRRATWLDARSRRFLRSLASALVDETLWLSHAQRAWLWNLAWTHRRKLAPLFSASVIAARHRQYRVVVAADRNADAHD